MSTAPSTASTQAGLVVRELSASVPDGDAVKVLLDRVDLTIEPGELVVITGPSGAGKSTLLALLGLLRRPQHGDVIVAGQSTAALREAQRARIRGEHIGIVYQSANLLPTLTASEQLEVVGRLTGVGRSAARRRAAELLAAVDMDGHTAKLPSQLSGGERQRVGIARALMAEPTVLLADEPTASLDPELAIAVVDQIARETAQRGLASVIVTHDPEPLRFAGRHLHLAHGMLDEVSAVAS